MSGDPVADFPKSRRWIKPIDFDLYDPEEPIPCLVGDPASEILIVAGELTGVCGEISSGKTIFQIGLAVSLAFGRDFLGFKVARPHRVLAVMADNDSERSIRRRAARFAAGLGITPAEMKQDSNLFIAPARGFCLEDAAGLAELNTVLKEFDPEVLSLETLISLAKPSRVMTEPGQGADFMNNCLRPLHRRPDGTDRSILVGAHYTKAPSGRSTRASKNRIGGSYSVGGGFDAALGLDGQPDQTSFRLSVSKPNREGIGFKPLMVEIDGRGKDPLRLIKGERPVVEEREPRKPGPDDKKRRAASAILADARATSNGNFTRADFIRLCRKAEPPIGSTTAGEVWASS